MPAVFRSLPPAAVRLEIGRRPELPLLLRRAVQPGPCAAPRRGAPGPRVRAACTPSVVAPPHHDGQLPAPSQRRVVACGGSRSSGPIGSRAKGP